MFCPVCRKEFQEGLMRCPSCNVILVSALPKPPKTSTQLVGAVVAWIGADLLNFSRVQAALADADIETYEADEHYHFTWEPSVVGGRRYAVLVHANDAARAAEAIRQAGVPLE